jgi:galactokinase/mevalonate kinase-like predicted kinase
MVPVIRASAPGRCGIIGNPTDGYGGTVISCSIAQRAHVEARPCDCLRIFMSGMETVLSAPGDFTLNGDYFDIPKSVLKFLGMMNSGIEIRAWSDIPFQAGLAGSTATMAALFGALKAFKKEKIHPYMIAEHIHEIEQILLNIQCGFQDHYMVVFGGLENMDFRMKEDCSFIDAGCYATIECLDNHVSELPFVLGHSGVKHHSGNVHRPIRERWLQGDPQVRNGYNEIARLARLGKKALIECDWRELGRLMNMNHDIQRELGGSGEINELLIKAALDAGAEGAKLAGAGHGGTIIALATEPEPVIRALKAAGAQDILFPKPSPGLQVRLEE